MLELASCLRPVPIGRILRPLLLLCVACGGGRSPLTDTTAALSTSEGDTQTSWDGGLLASTPDQIRCGSITCGYGDQCCLRREGSPASNACDSRSKGTCNGTQGTRVCDETADCYPGENCCWNIISTPPATIGSGCYPSANGSVNPDCIGKRQWIACGSDDDCHAAGAPPCFAQRCRGDILQSCGPIPSEFCPP